MQAVSELRKAVNEIRADYTALNAKEEISKALKDLSASSKITQKLGPSKEPRKRHQVAGKIRGFGSERRPSSCTAKTVSTMSM